MFDTEVAIVGAGAAGLSAARRLAALGVDLTVLEAKRRIGGRAHTDRTTLGLPFDLGCHWLHSADRNPLTRIAAAFGFTAAPNRLNRRIHGRNGWVTEAERDGWVEFERAQSHCLDEAGDAGQDIPASTLLDRTHRWSGLYEAWFGILNGAAPKSVSAVDLGRYRDSGDNRQVREGLGTLVTCYGAGIPVRLGAAVRTIRWGRTGIEVVSPAGRLRARTAIVTVSTTALGRERIRFEPRLPPEKIDAFEGLQLGHALRIAVRFPPGTFGADPVRIPGARTKYSRTIRRAPSASRCSRSAAPWPPPMPEPDTPPISKEPGSRRSGHSWSSVSARCSVAPSPGTRERRS